jgi:hypothetical protein
VPDAPPGFGLATFVHLAPFHRSTSVVWASCNPTAHASEADWGLTALSRMGIVVTESAARDGPAARMPETVKVRLAAAPSEQTRYFTPVRASISTATSLVPCDRTWQTPKLGRIHPPDQRGIHPADHQTGDRALKIPQVNGKILDKLLGTADAVS